MPVLHKPPVAGTIFFQYLTVAEICLIKYSGITVEKITAINNINNINKIRAL